VNASRTPHKGIDPKANRGHDAFDHVKDGSTDSERETPQPVDKQEAVRSFNAKRFWPRSPGVALRLFGPEYLGPLRGFGGQPHEEVPP
jgi:hypothetical protein